MSGFKNKTKIGYDRVERWFSVIDIICILTEQPDYQKVKNYWK